MMFDISKKRSALASIFRDKSGNFGIMTALILPVALATAGVAMDLTRLVQVKSELQNAADSAALAAASALSGKGLTDAEATELAQKFLASQMANLVKTSDLPDSEMEAMLNDIKSGVIATIERTSNGATAKIYDVTVNAHFDLTMNPLTQLLGYETVGLDASSTAQSSTESKNALSMYLVLDRSGSMGEDTNTVNAAQPTKQVSYSCNKHWNGWKWVYDTCYRDDPNYVIKIDALKVAVADLTTQLDTADPDKQYVRTAAISYNSSSQKATSFEWGTSTVASYVDALYATGGTDSSNAMKSAYKALTGTTEDNAHKAKNGQVPSKYIVFMTDGDNNYSSADTATQGWCDTAKSEGMEIYTVAFMAPTRGQALLQYCASSTSHYYDAQDATELVEAFQEIGQKATQAATRLTN